MLAGKRARLVEQLAEIQDSIDFVDAKQRFYDDVLSGATPYVSVLIPSAALVVPEFLRTLVFARPRGDDQFADCTFSPSLDMSR